MKLPLFIQLSCTAIVVISIIIVIAATLLGTLFFDNPNWKPAMLYIGWILAAVYVAWGITSIVLSTKSPGWILAPAIIGLAICVYVGYGLISNVSKAKSVHKVRSEDFVCDAQSFLRHDGHMWIEKHTIQGKIDPLVLVDSQTNPPTLTQPTKPQLQDEEVLSLLRSCKRADGKTPADIYQINI